jgi:DNA-binding beta-propeller fold protein YncE
LTLDGSKLYVADTENHAIRQIDLEAQSVITVAGTGEQGFNRTDSGLGPDMALNSPWDVVAHEGKVYIAMAGPHQLWAYDTESGAVGPYAGSGREDLVDGRLMESAMNQPSGIDTDGLVLYFADPEASAVRTADLNPDGEVRTIVGMGLFEFGDVDGTGDEVRLQHALGVTVADDGFLYVADTYNNKIKRIDPMTRESVTFVGTGDEGLADGESAQFYEPGGIDYANGKLYVADTNNHVIRVVDVESQSVSTVEFPNADRLLAPAPDAALEPSFVEGEGDIVVTLPPETVQAGEGTLVIDVTMPEGYKLNDLAPLPDLPLEIPVTFVAGQTELTLDLAVYWCEGVNQSLCFVDRAKMVVPLSVVPEYDNHSIRFIRELVPPVIEDTLG